jgi:pyruvate formate lyase activating enzyme
MSLQITNIQRFSLYDGPGIRTTIFLKGCSLDCPWCCNPENIKKSTEFYFNITDCIKCRKCTETCPMNLLTEPQDLLKINESNLSKCFKCLKCIKICPSNALGVYGKQIGDKSLLDILKKDEDFYSINNGGITFSGGEPLLQAPKLLGILKNLKDEKINVTFETSLFAPLKYLKLIQNLVDLFIIDIKILDETYCNETIKGNLKNFKGNINEIMSKNKNFIFRFPLIKPFTFNENNINLLYNFINEHKIEYLEIFKVHTLASNKYESLGLKFVEPENITENEVNMFKKRLIEDLGIKVKVLNL